MSMTCRRINRTEVTTPVNLAAHLGIKRAGIQDDTCCLSRFNFIYFFPVYKEFNYFCFLLKAVIADELRAVDIKLC